MNNDYTMDLLNLRIVLLVHRIANDVSILFEATVLGQTMFTGDNTQNSDVGT